MTSRRIIYLGVLAGCLVFYFCYQQWLSWILLLMVSILPLLSLLLSLPAMLQFRAEVEAPEQGAPGDMIEVSLWGLSHLPQPRFLGKLTREDLLTGETTRHDPRKPLTADHCGGIRLGVKRLRVCDYLGLFTIPVRSIPSRTIVIRPVPAAMDEMPDLSRAVPRAWIPKHGGGFAENHELRLYRPGDSLNQVHWKLSAKTGQLILREPMEPCLDRLVLTMDLRGDRQAIDHKCGQLLWLSRQLLERNRDHEIHCLTADGVLVHGVSDEDQLIKALDDLLCHQIIESGTLRDRVSGVGWQFHIGGDCHEG